MPYFKDISIAYKTLKDGLKLTFSHLMDATKSREPLGVEEENYFDQQNGLFTTQYPFESLPVPDNGRYRLDNEIDDCIVCDKCAKICPVNCIDIEPIKSTEEIGKTSDGTSKRLYAAKFDIDMAKCCFCGLCTTVCPTECLTMTKAYDFSEFDIKLHNYAFGNMSEEEIKLRKQEEEEAARKKEEEKLAKLKAKEEASKDVTISEVKAKPKFVPKVKPKATSDEVESSEDKPKPKFRPKMKPKVDGEASSEESKSSAAKPKFRPKIKTKTEEPETKSPENSAENSEAKPKFRPKIKPKSSSKDKKEGGTQETSAEASAEKPKPKFRPKIKPKVSKPENKSTDETGGNKEEKPKPKFRPKPVIRKKKE